MSNEAASSGPIDRERLQMNLLRMITVPLLSVAFAGVYLFPEFAIGGTGIGLLLFLLLALGSTGLLLSGRLPDLGMSVRMVVFGSSLFVLTMATAFVLGGHLQDEDLRYLASLAVLPLWFVLMRWVAGDTQGLVRRAASHGFAVASIGLVIIAGVLVLADGDLFVLREKSHFEGVWSVTAASNGNIFARTCLALFLTQMIECNLGGSRGVRQRALVLSICLLGLILLTLSRANIAAAVCMASFSLLLLRSSVYRVLIALSIPALVVGLALVPSVGDRWADMVGLLDADVMGEKSQELRPRSRVLQATIRCLQDNPGLGVGKSGELKEMKRRGAVKGPDAKPIAVHGTLLKIGVYGGLFSVFSFIVFLFLMAFALSRREPGDDAHGGIAARKVGWYGLAFVMALFISSVGADSLLTTTAEITLAWVLAVKVGDGRGGFSSDRELADD